MVDLLLLFAAEGYYTLVSIICILPSPVLTGVPMQHISIEYRVSGQVCECARRLLLTGVLVFLVDDSAEQVAFSCVFAFVRRVNNVNVWLYYIMLTCLATTCIRTADLQESKCSMKLSTHNVFTQGLVWVPRYGSVSGPRGGSNFQNGNREVYLIKFYLITTCLPSRDP